MNIKINNTTTTENRIFLKSLMNPMLHMKRFKSPSIIKHSNKISNMLMIRTYTYNNKVFKKQYKFHYK